MPRFLILLGTLLVVVAIFEPGNDITEIASAPETAAPETEIVAIPDTVQEVAARELHAAIEDAQSRMAAAAISVAADVEPQDEPIETTSQTSTAASDDAAGQEISPSPVLLSPYEMKVAAQTELKRLSCYDAKIDGIWGSQSREAVELYNESSDSSFHLNESIELLTALRNAPDNLCDNACVSSNGSSCELVASVEENTTETAANIEQKELPSYLPPWMRGETLAAADSGDTKVNDTFSSTHTSVSQRVDIKKWRPRKQQVIRHNPRRKKSWLPENWPGN